MEFRVNPKIFQTYPGVKIGVIVVKELDNTASANPELLNNIKETTKLLLQTYSIETILQEPFVARWREIYRTFGAKPSDYRSSIENLIRMALKGRELGHINTLVDVYNVISLKYRLPVGGEDTDQMVGDLQLTVADGSEPAVQLLGDQEAEKPFVGEVLYRDDEGVICRCWNWREGKRTMLTKETKNAVLVIEANDPCEYKALDAALDELDVLVTKFTVGKTTRGFLDANCPSMRI